MRGHCGATCPLVSGQTVTRMIVTKNTENFFLLSLEARMKGLHTSGDCDMYMRLTNVSLESLIGRTVIHRSACWLVTAIAEDREALIVQRFNSNGKLLVRLLSECTLYPTDMEIRSRYSRLLTMLRHTCLLTQTEAESAVIGFIVNGFFHYGSEAVSRIGGSGQAIRHAIARRHYVQRSLRRIAA